MFVDCRQCSNSSRGKRSLEGLTQQGKSVQSDGGSCGMKSTPCTIAGASLPGQLCRQSRMTGIEPSLLYDLQMSAVLVAAAHLFMTTLPAELMLSPHFSSAQSSMAGLLLQVAAPRSGNRIRGTGRCSCSCSCSCSSCARGQSSKYRYRV